MRRSNLVPPLPCAAATLLASRPPARRLPRVYVAVRKSMFLFRLRRAERERAVRCVALLVVLLFVPAAAHASPFDSGISSIQTLFTGTIAKAAALIAIVIGGFGFAFGDPGAKKNLAGVAMGTGIAVMAANVLTWLWGS